MPVGLTIEYRVGTATGEAAVERLSVALERAGDNIADFGRYVFPRLVPVFEEEVKSQFDARGHGPVASAWAPLSRSYAKWKEENFPGKGILERTGDMREGLTNSTSPFALRDFSSRDFNFGTRNLPYTGFHQLGTSTPMPARPPFDFRGELERKLVRAAADGLREAMRNAGLDEPTGDA